MPETGTPPPPDPLTLAAFGLMSLIAGLNVVGVRFSNFELAPFWGAGLRFALASDILLLVAIVRRAEVPRGRHLAGALLYGMLAVGLFFTFVYWALVRVNAGTASVMLSLSPLATLFLAVAVGLERLRLPSLLGGGVAFAGIALIFLHEVRLDVSPWPLLALLGGVACFAGANVVAKRLPPIDVFALNAIGMGASAVWLFGLSLVTGETWRLPTRTATWTALAYLVLFGSVLLFALFLFVVRRWTASGVSYQFVIMPVVAITAAGLLVGEPITPLLVAGAAITLAGVYVGALWRPRASRPMR